nr:DUF1549 domain-containing protein [Crateriforma spongiae]
MIRLPSSPFSHPSAPGGRRVLTAASICLAWFVFASVDVQVVRADDADSMQRPEMCDRIDARIESVWTDWEMRPSAEADDATWCRRVFLDLIGRIPSVAELEAFTDDRSPQKHVALVQRLLHDDRYTAEYANHWAGIWTNLLIGRSGGMDRRSLTDRSGMQKYLRDSFAGNRTYDKIVFDLITATGTTKPGTENFNGAVNFLVDKVNAEKGTLATSSTSRIFLGQQVQCTQCHNHPFNQWKQQKFWEFNSFFRQTRALRRFQSGTRDIDHAELIDQDFAGEAGDPDDALVFYELRNGLTKVAYPVFTDGTEVDVSGFVSDVNRRQELARLMLQSEFLDKMIVNRMWAHFLGYGFTRPIDDLGPHNPPTHPELLDELAAEFRRSSYDLKKLQAWITLSRPYRLSATKNATNELDDPSIGETPKFSRFYLRQMSAEQLYQSLLTATGATPEGSYEEQEQQRRRWLQQFVVAFGTDEGDEATTFNGSIPQALMLFNGELTRRATKTETGGFLDRLTRTSKSPRESVRRLFLAGLARQPTAPEIRIAAKLMAARGGDQKEMLGDMWWAILNSNEFIMQH